jgi:alpha/beta superfamily hydrolase
VAAVRVARSLAEAGIGVLRFDFAGLGQSDGRFGERSFPGDVADLACAAEAMAATGRRVSLLVGQSFGGAAVLAAAGLLPNVQALATIGAPFEVDHILNHFDPTALARLHIDGEGEVLLGGRPFHLSRNVISGLRHQDFGSCIAALHRPLLIMHAPRDDTVGIENATRIFQSAKHPKSFISLEDADHMLSVPDDARYAADVIAGWAARYLKTK